MDQRTLAWSGDPEWQGGWRAEVVTVELSGGGLRASGSQLGREPVPYRIDYWLDATGYGFITRSLQVHGRGAGWERRLRLDRAVHGDWTVEASGVGEVDLPAPGVALDLQGGDASVLAGAVDCDLGFSPLTNTMPVRRHELHRRPGSVDSLMAWVSVPDLSVRPLAQRYTHVRQDGEESIVRYESVIDGKTVFSSDLELDADGLVRRYPKLARRIP